LIKLLTKDAWCGPDYAVQGVCLLTLARCAGEAVADGRLILRMRNGEKCLADRNGEEKVRLKIVELGGLRPIVELLKSPDLDVAGKAAFLLACLALDSPVRLAIHILGGVECLLALMKVEDKVVVNNASLCLSQILQHVEAKDELYRLHGMKVLLDQGVGSDSVDVQENSARAVAYAIETEGNLKDLRRQMGIDRLIEMLAALPSSTREPNDRVRQSACFALAVSAFDEECRTEIRMKQGLRALSTCLNTEDSRVQEEALMALANCAYDMPCKQTIGSLGGMRAAIGLLSNPEQPVVANACVFISRLLFDKVSGDDFIEEEGPQQMLEVLQSYTKQYKAYVAQQEKLSSEQPLADGEPVLEMPDLRLGRSILLACKSCAEQGNVREQPLMSAPGGFYDNMMVTFRHTDEVVSGMSCQALCNAAFDDGGRTMLLEKDAIKEFVRCLMYKDVETQLAAARAIGNFAMDSVGRKKVKSDGAMPPLVKQLQAKDENGKDAIEPRRAAIQAIGKCASDRDSAVELCDIGALSQLLTLMDTHWKQLGQAAEDAVERLLAKSQSAKLWLRGELDYEDMTDDGWFDMGLGKPYTSRQVLQQEKVGTDREVLLADGNADEKLKEMLTLMKEKALELGLNEDVADKRDEQSTQIKRDVVRMMATTISDCMGGPIAYEQYNDFGYATDIQRCKETRKSNVVWIGDIRKGVCRHRAFTFKYACDKILPYLCRLERSKIDRGLHVGHAWNCIKFYGDNDVEGKQRTYTLDLMHNVGEMYENGTDVNPQDEWVPLYQRKDIYAQMML